MIYAEAPIIYIWAIALGISLSALFSIAFFTALSAKAPKKYIALAGTALAFAVMAGAWGGISSSNLEAASDTAAIEHFTDEYGVKLDRDEAVQIREHLDQDHLMYLEANGVTTEILFRNIDGAVEPFVSVGDGIWTQMAAAE